MTFLDLDHCGMVSDPLAAHINFALLALLLLLSLTVYLRARIGRQRLAPGPKGHWFLGNAAQIPAEKPWLWYLNLHEEYGAVSRITSITPCSPMESAGDLVRLTVPGSEIYDVAHQNKFTSCDGCYARCQYSCHFSLFDDDVFCSTM